MWFTEITGNKIGRITRTGNIVEFDIPTAASGPVGICKGTDDCLWFVEIIANKIEKITTTGEFIEYPLLTENAKPHAIASGNDGDIWFTEWGSNKIGRISYVEILENIKYLHQDQNHMVLYLDQMEEYGLLRRQIKSDS